MGNITSNSNVKSFDMTTPRIEELKEIIRLQVYIRPSSLDDARAIWKTAEEAFDTALTEAHQAGRDEAVEKVKEIKKVREYTGFCDRTGTKIYAGDWLEFKSNWMGEQIWAGMVIFEDGVWTIDITNKKTIKNSEKWSKEYPDRDWVSSRAWAIDVGYGEYGSWNERRKSISEIAGYFKTSDEMFKVRDEFNKKYGKYHSNDNLQRELPVKIIKGVSPETTYKLNSTGYNEALDNTIKALQDNK